MAQHADILALVRQDLHTFTGYRSARADRVSGEIWLNANECPWDNPAAPDHHQRRYPDPQPARLRQALATLYGCRPEQLLMGRGSDEGIDLLIRALCYPGRDAVVFTPPVFGMYSVCARLQDARQITVPLIDQQHRFCHDTAGLIAATQAHHAKLVFVCSPSNPTGQILREKALQTLLEQLAGQAVVVVDEAYGEFSRAPSACRLLDRYANLVVLRTLSKAYGLAGTRIGSLLAHPDLIALLRCCQAPYPIPQPCAALAQAALTPAALAQTRQMMTDIISERARVTEALANMPAVRQVYPSEGNFLLVRLHDAQAAFAALLTRGIVVRDQRQAPQLHDALRITIGTPAQNAQVIATLQNLSETAA